MFDINGGEFVVLALLAALLLGPDRLPELARGAGRLIRRGRDFATGATAQMKEEMGVDLDAVDWRRYDPRQYHPRRIVQNALSDAFEDGDPLRPGRSGSTSTAAMPSAGRDGKPGASAAAAKRAEAARSTPAGRPGSRAGGSTARSAGGPGSAARDRAAASGVVSPVRPSPAPTTWADAARRAGVDDDAT